MSNIEEIGEDDHLAKDDVQIEITELPPVEDEKKLNENVVSVEELSGVIFEEVGSMSVDYQSGSVAEIVVEEEEIYEHLDENEELIENLQKVEEEQSKVEVILLPKRRRFMESLVAYDAKDTVRNVFAFPAMMEINRPIFVQYEVQDSIDYEGGYGISQRAILLKDKKPVIVKLLLTSKGEWPRELALLNNLVQHANVLTLLYYFFVPYKAWMYLISESLKLTLRELMDERGTESLPYIYIKVYTFQLFRAIGHIHSYKICHRNIKPENIFVDHDQRILKLYNFRQGKLLSDGIGKYCCAGTAAYSAPEVLLCSPKYTLAIDIWSAGCVVGELLNKNKPITVGNNSKDIFNNSIRKLIGSPTVDDLNDIGIPKDEQGSLLKKKRLPSLRKIYKKWRKEDLEFVEELLQYSPSKRPTALSVFHKHFFSKLRNPDQLYPNKERVPDFFKFTDWELEVQPDLEWVCTNHT